MPLKNVWWKNVPLATLGQTRITSCSNLASSGTEPGTVLLWRQMASKQQMTGEKRDTWDRTGADLLTHCVALGKLLDISVPPFILCKAAKSDSMIPSSFK